MSKRYKAGLVTASEPSSSGTPYTGVASGSWSRQAHMQAVGESLWPRSPGLPGPPTNVQASAGNSQATITFTAPDNGGSAITSYTVTSSSGQTASGSSSPITVTGLTNGNSYTFTVYATNQLGNGPLSSSSNSITPIALITGEAVYTTAGLYNWQCPAGVESVSVVCIGSGNYSSNSDAYFISQNTVSGGSSNQSRVPGNYVGDGGGSGGYGGYHSGFQYCEGSGSWGSGGGGGGAGGYAGQGGHGGSSSLAGNCTDGYGGGGGGTGIYGSLGETGGGQGGGGSYGNFTSGYGGAGASGGGAGVAGGDGGTYGGGRGGYWSTNGMGGGGLGWKNNIPVTQGSLYAVNVPANGAVRIIYGPGRAFPNTNTGFLGYGPGAG